MSSRPSSSRRRKASRSLPKAGEPSVACKRIGSGADMARRLRLDAVTGGDSGRLHDIGLPTLAAVPHPTRCAYGVDAGYGCEMIDGEPGNRCVTAPFAFARHYDIEVKLRQYAHALRAHGRVDAGEHLVEHHQSWRVGACAAVVGCGGCKKRQRKGQCLFTARAGAIGSLVQSAPHVFLLALYQKSVPAPIIERA